MIEENININTSHVWVILFFSLHKIEITVGYLLQLELCLAGTHDPLWVHLSMLAWCLITQTGNQHFQWRFTGMLAPRDQYLKLSTFQASEDNPEVFTTTVTIVNVQGIMIDKIY